MERMSFTYSSRPGDGVECGYHDDVTATFASDDALDLEEVIARFSQFLRGCGYDVQVECEERSEGARVGELLDLLNEAIHRPLEPGKSEGNAALDVGGTKYGYAGIGLEDELTQTFGPRPAP
jgi:hypothetical protein